MLLLRLKTLHVRILLDRLLAVLASQSEFEAVRSSCHPRSENLHYVRKVGVGFFALNFGFVPSLPLEQLRNDFLVAVHEIDSAAGVRL